MPTNEYVLTAGHKSVPATVKATLLAVTVALAGGGNLQAADDYGYLNDAVITNHALSNFKGILGVNQAAGDLNLQANVRAVSDAPGGTVTAEVYQSSINTSVNDADSSYSRIDENAFQNTVGLLSINQASGSGNAESNSIAILPGGIGEALADDLLAEASLDAAQSSGKGGYNASKNLRHVNVDATAFRGAKGVLQLNQAAGMHNTTRNRIVMQIAP